MRETKATGLKLESLLDAQEADTSVHERSKKRINVEQGCSMSSREAAMTMRNKSTMIVYLTTELW